MHYLIYKITNRLNNKIYVGKHKTENKDDDYFGSGLLLKRAIEKYGKENFSKEILFECSSEEEMNKKESDIVDQDFIERDDTYNLMEGGCGGFSYILNNKLNQTDSLFEHLRLIGKLGREKLEELKRDPNWKEFHSNQVKLSLSRRENVWNGRKHTEESKKKSSQTMKGRYSGEKNPWYGYVWINDGQISTRIKNTDSIPSGFTKGRLSKRLS